jgi:DNA-directed RNA polymerase I, II, and III subunit RPABC2
MSDNEYEPSDSESSSDNEVERSRKVNRKTVLPSKPGGIVIKAALYGGGYGDDDDDADMDEDDEDDDEDAETQVGGDDDEDDEDDEAAADTDDDSDIEVDEDAVAQEPNAQLKPVKANKGKKPIAILDDEDDDDYDEYDESYLQKFDNEVIRNYVNSFHPECLNHNNEEIAKLSVVVKNSDGIIVDPLHRTIPYLTKYERARVLGQRAKQIETGAKPLVKVPETIVDGYLIAELELREKKIPFIIRRPIPGGGCEYWSIKDLEIVAY